MTNFSLDYDMAVIGAGMAGLTCAKQLQKAGDRVVILEKSRGVGWAHCYPALARDAGGSWHLLSSHLKETRFEGYLNH